MKKITITLLFSLIVLFEIGMNRAQAVFVSVDGEDATEAFVPKLIDGSVYVGWRAFCEDFGAEVSYDAATRSSEAKTETNRLSVCRDDRYLTANGRCLYLPSGVILEEGRMFVPLRPLAAAFGAEVSWDAENSTARVDRGGAPFESAERVYEEEDLYWLARIIEAESGGEPFLGKLAVGGVVMNRVASRDYPDSVRQVIFDRKGGVQFSPAADGTLTEEPSEDSIAAAKLCLEGINSAGESLYFFNPDIAVSRWITQNRTYVMTVGAHDFYA